MSVAVSPLSFPDKRAGEEKCGVDTLTEGEVAWIWDSTDSEFAGLQDSPMWTASERGVMRQSGIVCCQKGLGIDE